MTETRCTCGAGHETFGACIRAKGIRIAYCQSADGKDYTKQKAWDRELDLYQSAKAQGVQPAGTSTEKVRTAMELSDRTGSAFQAGTGLA